MPLAEEGGVTARRTIASEPRATGGEATPSPPPTVSQQPQIQAPTSNGSLTAQQTAALNSSALQISQSLSQKGATANQATSSIQGQLDAAFGPGAGAQIIANSGIQGTTGWVIAPTAAQEQGWYSQLVSGATQWLTNNAPVAPPPPPVQTPVDTSGGGPSVDTSGGTSAANVLPISIPATIGPTPPIDPGSPLTTGSGGFNTTTIPGAGSPNSAVYDGNGNLIGTYDASGAYQPGSTSGAQSPFNSDPYASTLAGLSGGGGSAGLGSPATSIDVPATAIIPGSTGGASSGAGLLEYGLVASILAGGLWYWLDHRKKGAKGSDPAPEPK